MLLLFIYFLFSSSCSSFFFLSTSFLISSRFCLFFLSCSSSYTFFRVCSSFFYSSCSLLTFLSSLSRLFCSSTTSLIASWCLRSFSFSSIFLVCYRKRMTRSKGLSVAAVLFFLCLFLAWAAAVAEARSAILKTSSIGMLYNASNLTLMSSKEAAPFFFFFLRFSASASVSVLAAVPILVSAWVSTPACTPVYNLESSFNFWSS